MNYGSTRETEEDDSVNAIALVYHHATSSSQIWAHAVGLHDQSQTEEL